jgi:lysophospholipase L1-like esterase
MKKISINFIIFIFLFIFCDLIFSNFIHKETFKYACYKYEIDFYSLRPNCVAFEEHETSGITFKVHTDDNGYRYLGKKRDKTTRNTIIFLGDSQTYAVGLEYKNSFVGKIEKNFKNYKVLNLAVPSYGPTVYNYQLKKIIKSKNKPNKIFLILDIGDIAQASFRWETKKNLRPNLITVKKKEEEASGWKRFRRKNFKGYRIVAYNLRELSRSIRKNFKNQNNILCDNFSWQYINNCYTNEVKKTYWGEYTYTDKNKLQKKFWQKITFDETLKKVSKNLSEISLMSKNIDSEFYIVIFPWAETLEYGQDSFNYENYAFETCKNVGCTKLINLFPTFREHKNNSPDWRKEFYLADDIHLNEKGQDLIYNEILKNL